MTLISNGLHVPSRGIDAVSQLSNIVDVLRWRAEHQGTETAFHFLHNGDRETVAMNYQALDTEVRRLAGRLQAIGLENERVLLLLPTGPDYVIAILACLYAGAIAVPLDPPRPNRSWRRLETVSGNARPQSVITTAKLRDSLGTQLEELIQPFGGRVITINESDDASPNDWQPRSPDAEAVAYLQYTSGSTLDPKGVMITHANLLHNCRAIATVAGEHQRHLVVSWLPFFHDMGLVGTLFFPITLGCPLVFMSPEAFVMRPIRWLRAISQYRATLSPAPNFAYDLCVERTNRDQRAELDLSSWRVAFNGSERIDAMSLHRFTEAFAPCGFSPETFMPCYGLAEATLMVTRVNADEPPNIHHLERSALDAGEARPDEDGVAIVSGGHPIENMDVAIVDAETQEYCRPGQIGEIWLSGESVALGYWNDPELTAKTFQAHVAGESSRPFFRTGDLGFEHDGEVFVTGRLKDLIIIEGRNIYPDDVEATVENAHPAISPHSSIAFSAGDGPRERLVVVAAVNRSQKAQLDADELERTVREAVARQNDVALSELVLVNRRELPKTANGKKQRSACRTAYVDGSLERLFAAETLDEATLRTWMRRRVAREIGVPEDEVDPDAGLMSMGIDSMTLIGMAGELAELLGRDVPAEILWDHDTISSLARHLAGESSAPARDAKPADGSRFSAVPNQYLANASHWSTVRAIQPGGDRLPLFLVHGVGGGIGVYHQLASCLGEDQPTYGLQQPSEQPTTVEEMAQVLIDGVRTVQRKGPYHLGGYCFGGVVAFEMARRLQQMKEDVALVAMFDVPSPAVHPPRPLQDAFVRARVAGSAIVHAPSFLTREFVNQRPELLARAKRQLSKWSHRLQYRLHLTDQPKIDHYMSQFFRKDHLDVNRINIMALREYSPQIYHGRLVIFESREFQLFHGATPWHWRKLAAGGIERVRVPGQHQSMLQGTSAEFVAGRLRAHLQREGS